MMYDITISHDGMVKYIINLKQTSLYATNTDYKNLVDDMYKQYKINIRKEKIKKIFDGEL